MYIDLWARVILSDIAMHVSKLTLAAELTAAIEVLCKQVYT